MIDLPNSLNPLETFDYGFGDDLTSAQAVAPLGKKGNGRFEEGELKARVDTDIEVEYIRNGGIHPYVLRDIIKAAN